MQTFHAMFFPGIVFIPEKSNFDSALFTLIDTIMSLLLLPTAITLNICGQVLYG